MHRIIAISVLMAAQSTKPDFSSVQVERAVAQHFHESHVELPRGYFSKIIPAHGNAPPMMVIYLYGSSDWCGSSGCGLLVLAMGRDGPKVVSEETAWPPITLDGRSSFGHPIIGAWHHGGGVLKPYCDEISFTANGLGRTHETKREQAAEQRRCSSSTNIIYNWPKAKSKH